MELLNDKGDNSPGVNEELKTQLAPETKTREAQTLTVKKTYVPEICKTGARYGGESWMHGWCGVLLCRALTALTDTLLLSPCITLLDVRPAGGSVCDIARRRHLPRLVGHGQAGDGGRLEPVLRPGRAGGGHGCVGCLFGWVWRSVASVCPTPDRSRSTDICPLLIDSPQGLGPEPGGRLRGRAAGGAGAPRAGLRGEGHEEARHPAQRHHRLRHRGHWHQRLQHPPLIFLPPESVRDVAGLELVWCMVWDFYSVGCF